MHFIGGTERRNITADKEGKESKQGRASQVAVTAILVLSAPTHMMYSSIVTASNTSFTEKL